MPTPGERKALLFLGTVVALGAVARGVAALHSAAPMDAAARRALETQIEAVDSVRHGQSKRKGKGRRRSSRADQASGATPGPAAPYVDPQPVVPAVIDLDVASAAEIETLRGVGPALAARIVADRDSLGPFGSTDELQRVRGIGARLAAKIAPQVTFSLLPRHPGTAGDGTSAPPRGRRKPRRGESHN
jgi:competence ComEA-like helix-hairpin-helix protein